MPVVLRTYTGGVSLSTSLGLYVLWMFSSGHRRGLVRRELFITQTMPGFIPKNNVGIFISTSSGLYILWRFSSGHRRGLVRRELFITHTMPGFIPKNNVGIFISTSSGLYILWRFFSRPQRDFFLGGVYFSSSPRFKTPAGWPQGAHEV